MKQPEALRIAELCDNAASAADMGRPPVATDWRRRAAAELRRQHALIAELTGALRGMADEFVKVYPIYYYAEPWAHDTNEALKFARAALAKAEAQQ